MWKYVVIALLILVAVLAVRRMLTSKPAGKDRVRFSANDAGTAARGAVERARETAEALREGFGGSAASTDVSAFGASFAEQSADSGAGLSVVAVEPQTAAEQAGLVSGARLVSLGEVPVRDAAHLRDLIAQLRPGLAVNVAWQVADEHRSADIMV